MIKSKNEEKFFLINKLGEGAFCVVYKAKRVQDGKIYALKKIPLKNLKEKELENALNEI